MNPALVFNKIKLGRKRPILFDDRRGDTGILVECGEQTALRERNLEQHGVHNRVKPTAHPVHLLRVPGGREHFREETPRPMPSSTGSPKQTISLRAAYVSDDHD